MSDAFALAAVTAALKTTLRNAVSTPGIDAALGGMPTVSALPPDRVNPAGNADPNQLNLFLYAVAPNQGWSNLHQPVRDPAGARVDNQPLALDLHYLLTAYAAADYGAEILLGHGMQALHEVPFFTREWLKAILKPGPPPNDIPAALETSGLAEQIEQIRITPKPLSADEMSKIWTAVQGRYRPTAAYVITVVLIESRRSRRAALPVLERNIPVVPWSEMRIDAATNAAGDTFPIIAGTTVRLRGSGLGHPDLKVAVAGVDVSATISKREDTELEFALDDPLPAGLRAGLLAVYVSRPLVGTAAFSSNAVGLLLRPEIGPPAFAAGRITVTLRPKVTAIQRVTLLLNERRPASGTVPKAYTFAAPAHNGVVAPATDTGSVAFTITGVAAGTYVVRVQVDGADSLLDVDAQGRFDQPRVTIP